MFFPLVTNKIIDPLRCRMNKWHKDVGDIYKKINTTESLSYDEMSALQERKLKTLSKQAVSGSTFYKKLFHDAGVTPETICLDLLSELPALDRQTIRNNFEGIINQNFVKNQMKMNGTGGSCGEPLSFYQSNYSKLWSSALFLRGLHWCGMKKGYPHVKLWGAPTDVTNATKNINKRVWNYLYNRRAIDAFNLSDDLFEKEYQAFMKKKPYMLESYSNILYEFARYLKLTNKKPLFIPSAISSAGVLYDFQRQTIQETISKNVFNRYGSREFGNIAQECSFHTGMHINMERFIIEIDQPDHEQLGDILVTDLENHAFPFIRYKIGDIGKLSSERCECGRKLIMFKQVVGRSLDTVKTLTGRKISGVMFPHFFKDFPEIILGQVIQDKIDHLEIRLKLLDGVPFQNLELLINKIKKVSNHELNISVKTNQDFIINPTGKYRPVISKIN